VKLAAGEVEHLRGKLAAAEASGSEADLRALLGAFASAIERLARVSKAGVDADLDGRRLELDSLVLTRLGDAVSRAIEDSRLSAEDRSRLDAALRQRLGELSDEDLRPARREVGA